MARSTLFRLFAVVVCLLFVGVMVGLAVEGTVVSYEKGKLVVKIGDKNEEISTKGVKLIGKDGNAIKGKDAVDVFKAGTKVDVTKEGDKVKEVKVK